MAPTSMTGRLLVATPLIDDDTFRRTVVLLLAHAPEDGAFGVILNRPTDTPARELLQGWGERAAAPGVLFVGGPVDSDSLVGLAAGGAVDLHLDPDDRPDAPPEIRLYAGQSGWSPGQLEDEIDTGAWWVVEAEDGDALTRDPSALWARVLRRQSGTTAWFANHPEDLRTG